MATKLGLKQKDPSFNQFCIYSWFKGVKKPPERFDGFTLFYFIGLNKAWSWHIPLRNDVCSMGVVVDKDDFQKSGKDTEEFFYSLVRRNRTFTHAMQDAERIRPWWIEGDYSYKIDTFTGPGWLIVGDALRFVDPIFSSGVDVALFSSLYAYETIKHSWETGDEAGSFADYQARVTTGIDIWYDLIETFYSLQNLVTRYATRPLWREWIVRTLQGNPYIPETQERARTLLAAMHESYDQITSNPDNLLRPWGMSEVLRRNIEWDPGREAQALPCPTCGGRVRYDRGREVLVCGTCGLEADIKLSASVTGESRSN
jgi:FADH2 O2-dependent halogenase